MGTEEKKNREAPAPLYEEANRFVDTATGLAVIIHRRLGREPVYSFRSGWLREDGSLAPVQVRRDRREQLKLCLEADVAGVLGTLMRDAQTWIEEQMQWHLYRHIDEVVARDERKVGRGRMEARVTGKTARKKAARSSSAAKGE